MPDDVVTARSQQNYTKNNNCKFNSLPILHYIHKQAAWVAQKIGLKQARLPVFAGVASGMMSEDAVCTRGAGG